MESELVVIKQELPAVLFPLAFLLSLREKLVVVALSLSPPFVFLIFRVRFLVRHLRKTTRTKQYVIDFWWSGTASGCDRNSHRRRGKCLHAGGFRSTPPSPNDTACGCSCHYRNLQDWSVCDCPRRKRLGLQRSRRQARSGRSSHRSWSEPRTSPRIIMDGSMRRSKRYSYCTKRTYCGFLSLTSGVSNLNSWSSTDSKTRASELGVRCSGITYLSAELLQYALEFVHRTNAEHWVHDFVALKKVQQDLRGTNGVNVMMCDDEDPLQRNEKPFTEREEYIWVIWRETRKIGRYFRKALFWVFLGSRDPHKGLRKHRKKLLYTSTRSLGQQMKVKTLLDSFSSTVRR